MTPQQIALVQSSWQLDAVVRGSSQLDELLPKARALAQRHVRYGMQPEHYDSIGMALLWTLEQGLGAASSAELRNAWTEAYRVLAGAMKRAAYGPDSPIR
jgi:nitric oxide dioxygenase